MSYAIGNIIYGIPLTEEIREAFQALDDPDAGPMDGPDDPDYLEGFGFETTYSGGAEYQPGWLGVKLGSLSEAKDVLVSALPKPTEAQKAEAKAKLDKLPASIREACGEPDLWIVWSTS